MWLRQTQRHLPALLIHRRKFRLNQSSALPRLSRLLQDKPQWLGSGQLRPPLMHKVNETQCKSCQIPTETEDQAEVVLRMGAVELVVVITTTATSTNNTTTLSPLAPQHPLGLQ